MTSTEGSTRAGDRDEPEGDDLLWKGVSSMVASFNLVSIPVATAASGSTTACRSGVGADSGPVKPSNVIDLYSDEVGEYVVASRLAYTTRHNAVRDGDE